MQCSIRTQWQAERCASADYPILLCALCVTASKMAIVTILLGLSLVGIVWLWFHLKRNHGRLDPALPKLPTILCFGSPPFLYNKIIYHKWYQSKYKELGRTFGKYEGVTPTICSIDPEFIKEVTVKQFDNFTDVIPHEFAPEQTTLDRAK